MTNPNIALEMSERLARLHARERESSMEFLLALADFDREERWKELGYPSLFTHLHRELGLSKGAAFYRMTAARLVQRIPEVIEPLRDGRLCILKILHICADRSARNSKA